MDRSYTVKEIDALRQACENRCLWGRYSGPVFDGFKNGVCSRAYTEDKLAAEVEELVRTHMLAGHTVQDLIDSEKPVAECSQEP